MKAQPLFKMLCHKNSYLFLAALLVTVHCALVMQSSMTVWKRPFFNWDVIAYTAAAMHIQQSDKQILYDKTIRALRRVNRHAREAAHGKQHKLLVSPASLYQQLPWYQVKPLYVGLTWFAHKIGISWSHATSFVSLSACIILLIALLAVPVSTVPVALWFGGLIAWGAIGGFGKLWYMARLSTPDMLGTACFVLGLIAAMRSKRLWVPFVIWLCAVAARPDLLLSACALIVCAALYPLRETRLDLPQAILGIGLLCAVYFVIITAAGHYGWWAHIHYHFFDKSAYPAAQNPVFDFDVYLRIVRRGFETLHNKPMVQKMAGITVLTLLLGFKSSYKEEWKKMLLILCALWGAFFVRYAVFPAWEMRYFVVYVFSMQLIFLRMFLLSLYGWFITCRKNGRLKIIDRLSL